MRRPLLIAGALLALAGCTSSGSSAGPTGPTSTRTVTETRSASSAPYVPPPASTVPPLPPGAKPRAGELEKACPYIPTGLDQEPNTGVNLADLEGDRVYRTTVLTDLRPVGCRFYFFAPPYEAIAEIRPRTFGTPTEAYNAMVRTAETGTEPIPERNFVDGVTGVCFRTRFFGPDGRKDWAFVFAKGTVMVTVYTQRTDTSRNALYIAKAIAGKF